MADARPPAPPRRWARWITLGAGAAIIALVTTLAVVWDGYDARETPLEDASVWALQTGEGRRYAKVNTALGELETVKSVENPSGIAQHDGRVLVFTDADARFADISAAAPPELNAESDADLFAATPAGTVDVVPAGDHVVFRTDVGDVFAARLSAGAGAVPVDPFADVETAEGEERPRLRADAVTVTPDGTVFAVSSALGLLIVADADSGEVREEVDLDVDAGALQLTAVGDRWVVFDTEGGTVWVAGRDEPLEVDAAAGAVLQQPAAAGAGVLIADAAGLTAVGFDGSAPQRTVAATGAPAAPAVVDGIAYGAWLGAQGGTLWSSDAGESLLDYGGLELGDDAAPAFAVNGRRGILNDTASGWVWTLPGGDLVPSSQQWEGEDTSQQEQNQELESERVIDPKPPVAVADGFGARAGHDALLPVLLNDHDPNEDVLSIVPDSVTGLDPAFGTVRSTNDDQQLVISVSADAVGSASFSYRVTDGTAADGLLSEPATVTVTVAPDDVNTPPVWCGVEGCLATWPAPQVAPGSTTTVDVLDGWVDPEGDPIYLASAVNTSGIGSVAADPAGTVTYQHPDPQAAEALTAAIDLVVADARGAAAERALAIAVVPAPELVADSFTVTGAIGLPVTVDVGAHLSGGSGGATLAAARALDEGAVTVTPNPAALSFTVTGDTPGSYTVQFTVRDGAGEATAIARITLVDPATTQISTPPLTAFVRPSEDSTVDVLSAVHNPAGLVLLASDLSLVPLDGATLSADAVDQNLIRVSGSTDDGQPGTLGVVRYTVSDGTGNAAGTTSGELTVVLLPAASAEPPIAVDDAVTVRAGAQIDIPALANDTAPASAVISIDPSKVVNESDAGLAFATPRQVRYLAPQEAGSYSLSYTVYRLGFPEMTDTARIFITVLPADQNTAPAPKDLVGRVLSGSSVEIPFDGYALDPDGDSVRLDRVATQPSQGSAAVSADGTALVYTSDPGSSGQDSFTFRVRDSRGETGTATVRVGVLNASSDPRPVTYSDYTQAQAGEGSEVVVRPADNDVDPAGSELELLDVRPYVAADSPEYDAVREMLLEIDPETGTVRIAAGTTLGTFSFVYTVRNRTGDTAQGLLVLKVVREAVPDYPVVTDTRLTSETREKLADGVDVIDGKVAWTTGDPSDLQMRLWGEPEDYAARGHRIEGPLPERYALVPFEVRGTSFDGREVISYGFLHVPGDDELTLTLRAAFADVRVDEKGSVEVDMAEAVAVPEGQSLQVSPEGLAAGGGRPEARCTHTGGTTVRYDAGAGAPWSDVCTVPVKLATQDEYTFLPLRFTVIAEAPQPELRAASVSVSPGDEVVYDLTSMTTWEGRDDWTGLQYAAGYAGDQFAVTQTGDRLTIVAADAARPGRTEPVVVTLPSHPEAAAATLTLTVGPAPATLPKGATVTERCSQAGGNTSCTITVVGRGGEVNPLPRTPLVLTEVTSPANCPGVTFSRASDAAITATWVADAAGAGNCQGSFVVQDAQQRQSSGDRNGTVILDLQGLPASAARLNWVGYTGDSVSLRVVSEAASYPAVTGYRVRGSNGVEVTCSAGGECPAIPGRNGEQIDYQAWAVNSVGESRQAVGTTAWAYQAPKAPSTMTAEPIGDQTARITVGVSDPSTRDIRLRMGGTELASKAVGGAASVTFEVNVGTNTGAVVTAVPTTSFTVPPATVVAGGSAEGQTRSVEAWGIGAPGVVIAFSDRNVSGFSAQVVVSAVVQTANARDAELQIGFSRGNERCVPSITVSGVTGSAESQPYDATLWVSRSYQACAAYVVDGRRFTVTTVSERHAPTGDIPAPTGDREYTITLGGADGDAQRTARLTKSPGLVIGNTDEYEVRYFVGDSSSTDVGAVLTNLTSATTVTARTCLIGDAGTCSSGVDLVPTDAPFLVQVTFPRTCGDAPTVVHPGSNTPLTAWTFAEPTFAAPVASVTFRPPLTMLGTLTYTYTNCVDPNPEPEPEPEPEPPVEPGPPEPAP